MARLGKITIKISLVILTIMSFSFCSSVLAQNIPVDQYDSIYQYNALQNKIHFPETGNVAIIPEVALSNNNTATIDDNAKKLKDITEEQNISTEKSDNAITAIENGGSLKTFFIGNKLGTLKYQLVQMKEENRVLVVLALDAKDSATENQINNQVESLKKQQVKVENFILKQEKGFSLFGWLVSSL